MAATTTPRRSRAKDLQGIRLRGGSYQVRVYGGRDQETGKQVILTGSAQDGAGAIRLRLHAPVRQRPELLSLSSHPQGFGSSTT